MPSIGYIRSYPIIGEVSDYCFYEDTITKLDYQSINFQIKLYNNSDDYYVYVWYSSDIQQSNLTISNNMTGTFDLNSTDNYMQDGFSVDDENTIYVVVIRNNTPAF